MEYVDILLPPKFEPSGETKALEEAWNAQDWIGTFNLWIVQRSPVPAIVYQQRSPKSSWAPLKLDVAAGGHYDAGELGLDGLREATEELGKKYSKDQVYALGRRLNVSLDTKGRMRHNVVSIYVVFDDAPLSAYALEEAEVYAICACPIHSLEQLHAGAIDSFTVEGKKANTENILIEVTRDSFPYNWDNYHQKMMQIVKRLVVGEKDVLY